ncbi:hypothetical protein Emag_003889 [Eimeria magna]
MTTEAQLRGRASRLVAAAAAATTVPDPQLPATQPLSDVCAQQADMSAASSTSLPISDSSPTARGGRMGRGRRSGVEAGAAVALHPGTAIEGAATRSVRRSGAGGTQQGAPAASVAPDVSAALPERSECTWGRDQGPRRSLRQAIISFAGSKPTPTLPAGGSEASAVVSRHGTAAPAPTGSGGSITLNANAAGTGRRRLRQLQRQALQNYTVGQQQQQAGSDEAQEGGGCLAEFLHIESNVPRCCCGSNCASSSATCGCNGGQATFNSSSSSRYRNSSNSSSRNCSSSSRNCTATSSSSRNNDSSNSSKNNSGSTRNSSSSSSRQTAAGTTARSSGVGASVRETPEVVPAAKRQRHQQHEPQTQQHESENQQQEPKTQQHEPQNQQQKQQQGGSSLTLLITEDDTAERTLLSPSWFLGPAEAQEFAAACILRPASPTRASIFFANQADWEMADSRDSAERAAATAGTPWPRGSTSCSFGGYGAATRAGGALPLCCHCGLPLRPPSSGAARGAGAETGCPLAAAASAANALGLETSTTQWCRCCTRIYGELRLQHHRDATSLPFQDFRLPRSPLRFVLLPADGARDLPGGVGAVAAALAAATADPRRGKHAPEESTAAPAPAPSAAAPAATPAAPVVSPGGTPAAPAAADHADGERDGSSSNSTPSLSLRRTRSGCHFPRALPARTSGRSSSLVDITRFRSASCCWPSNSTRDAYVQPISRLQQQLTQLLQAPVEVFPRPQHQQHARQASPFWTNAVEGLQSKAAARDAAAARPSSGAPLSSGTPAISKPTPPAAAPPAARATAAPAPTTASPAPTTAAPAPTTASPAPTTASAAAPAPTTASAAAPAPTTAALAAPTTAALAAPASSAPAPTTAVLAAPTTTAPAASTTALTPTTAAPAPTAPAGGSSEMKAEAGGENIPPSASVAAAGDVGDALCMRVKEEGDSNVCEKPALAGDTEEAVAAISQPLCASGEAAAEDSKISSSSFTTPPGDQQQQPTDIGTPYMPQSVSSTAVLPRVFMENDSGCYVATAFDPLQKQLLQKRFCCPILGEQRAHMLACQWLRWVEKGFWLGEQRGPLAAEL